MGKSTEKTEERKEVGVLERRMGKRRKDGS